MQVRLKTLRSSLVLATGLSLLLAAVLPADEAADREANLLFNTASLFFRRIHIRGVAVYTYSAPEAQEAWRQIVATLATTGARPLIDSQFEFERLPEAFSRLREGPLGKVILRCRR